MVQRLEMALAARRLAIPGGVAGARLIEVRCAAALGREAGAAALFFGGCGAGGNILWVAGLSR